jgi:3-oxoacyl-[acyl-carrier-protein] synthase II
MRTKPTHRVVVTGIGIITSIGASLPEFEAALFEGQCGIGTVTLFDTAGFTSTIAGQVKNDDLGASFRAREIKRASRCDLLGLIAVREALARSELDLSRCDREKIGVVLGGGAGGMLEWERYRRRQWNGNPRAVASKLLASSPCTLTDLIAGQNGLLGTRATITTACSSSATSIGYGFDLIRSGDQQIVIAGGSESLSELTFAGFNALRVMSPEACRPFDRYRRGLSLGEGAAILILEAYDHALDRGANVLAEILGYGINSDAYHMTSPDPEARGMQRVISQALARSNVAPEQIDYINAHGTGTQVNDAAETMAIKKVLGTAPAVSSTKSMIGHCLGAAGAIEAVAVILAFKRQMAPPTIHLEDADPACDLDYVPGFARPQKIACALSNSFAFGGNNTSLVLGRGN